MNRHLQTLLAQAGCRRDPSTGAISAPVHQTASFAHEGLGKSTGFDYSRTANPTRQALEETLAAAEGGGRGFAFASGMAAVDAVTRLLRSGDRLVATEDLYGGTWRYFTQLAEPMGIETTFVDTTDLGGVAQALAQPNVKALFVESLTNPLLKVADLGALHALARERGVWMAVDNTFLTPCLLRPFEWGADVVLYSATKYLAGHNDVVAGVVVCRESQMAGRLAALQNGVGAILGPQDSWLALRGLKTLPLRLRCQQDNALRLAHWLRAHPRVRRVLYPGLPTHPGHALLARQASGFGAMLSFEVQDAARITDILAGLKVFQFAESLGGVESLMTYPRGQTHADMPPAWLERLGLGAGLLRLSVGIEAVEDLIADLEALL